MKSSFAVVSLLFIPLIASYNVSPTPNIVLKVPAVDEGSSRSTYFGFSITLRKTHILISAPRANSSLYPRIVEPGMIYKCSFNTEKCAKYFMDKLGDTFGYKDYELINEKKEFSLLGFSMDGSEDEKDPFVACAPKSLTPYHIDNPKYGDYLMFGACYWKENTIDQPSESKVTKISPLRDHSLLNKPNNPHDPKPLYRYGEAGYSVHITENNKEILLGAPGVNVWMGTAVKYQIDKARYYHNNNYQGIVANNLMFDGGFGDVLKYDSYFGYSMTSGQFLKPNHNELFYVASAPRRRNGLVAVFRVINKFHYEKNMYYDYIKFDQQFFGTQLGSYFGYSIICDDFNNDKKPDVAVSAPFLNKKNSNETGMVFVYINDCTNDCFTVTKKV